MELLLDGAHAYKSMALLFRRLAEEQRQAEERAAEEQRLSDEQKVREVELARLAELEKLAQEEEEAEIARQAAELAGKKIAQHSNISSSRAST